VQEAIAYVTQGLYFFYPFRLLFFQNEVKLMLLITLLNKLDSNHLNHQQQSFISLIIFHKFFNYNYLLLLTILSF